MTNKEAIEYFKGITINMPLMEGFKANDAVKLAIKALQNQIDTSDIDKWIPIIFEYDSENKMYMIKGVIPSDRESIIVTDGKSVWDDTFIRDGIECYLDSGNELGSSVIAWQPYPVPYKVGSNAETEGEKNNEYCKSNNE